ncbi:MAG: biotin--[acetyl-CoA-carboxylase] ligase [Planctomycetota bacterium]
MRQIHDLDALVPVDWYESVVSTQAQAREAVLEGRLGQHGRLFCAHEQTGGIGRFGRRWHSPRGGLWCTLAWPVSQEIDRVRAGLGLRVGLGVIRALEHVLGAHGHGDRVMFKWPNDILLNGKKIAGVLCELVPRDGAWYALVGIGVNGNFSVSALPEDIAALSTTLMDEIGREANMSRLLDDIRARLVDALITEGLPEKTLALLRLHLYGVGRHQTITLPDGSVRSGELLGMDDDGNLRLRTEDGEFEAPLGAEVMAG